MSYYAMIKTLETLDLTQDQMSKAIKQYETSEENLDDGDFEEDIDNTLNYAEEMYN